ncbi:hypothetical protein VTH06DRAFT_3900 [Thermothelomyces fergusii]
MLINPNLSSPRFSPWSVSSLALLSSIGFAAALLTGTGSRRSAWHLGIARILTMLLFLPSIQRVYRVMVVQLLRAWPLRRSSGEVRRPAEVTRAYS